MVLFGVLRCLGRSGAVSGEQPKAAAMAFPTADEFEQQLCRTAGMACYGGADLKECLVIAAQITPNDHESWYAAWTKMADRLLEEGKATLEAGNPFAAKSLLLRAANYHRTAGFFLRGDFQDERLIRATQCAEDAWAALLPILGATEVRIPFKGEGLRAGKFTVGNTVKGTLVRAAAPPHGFATSPLVISIPGYDGQTQEDIFYSRPFLDAGCHGLVLSSPGRGADAILDYGPQMRPDEETTLSSAIDWALGEGGFKLSDGLVVYGCSLGGHFATRSMLYEHRPTLYVLDPPNYSMREMVLARLPGPLRKRYLAEISTLPKKTEGPWTATPPAIPISEEGFVARTIYSVVQRKMHFIGALKANMHGIKTDDPNIGIDAYLREICRYHTSTEDYQTMTKVPAILVDPENEPVAITPKPDGTSEHHAHTLLPHLPKGSLIVQGTAADGCDDHCFGGARLAFGEKVTSHMLPMLKRLLA